MIFWVRLKMLDRFLNIQDRFALRLKINEIPLFTEISSAMAVGLSR